MKIGRHLISLVAGLMLVGGSLQLAGCDANSGQGKLHGTVTYKGTAIPEGSTLSFVSGDGAAAVTKVDAEGKYQMAEGTKPGQYTVVVAPPQKEMTPEEAMKASMAGKMGDSVTSIPKAYRSLTTSPAKVEIKEGEAEYNLDMASK